MQTIHKFRQGNHYIVLDINSGAVHLVDKVIFQMLDYVSPPLSDFCPDFLFEKMPDTSRNAVMDCYGEIYGLYKDGLLYSEDTYRQYAKTEIDAPVKALCLHVAHDCNLRCKYCFASTGDFGKGRSIMSVDTGKKAIDFLLSSSSDRRDLEVDFFGGEPLMAWDTVKAVVEYARIKEKEHDKIFRFTITTNGVLLDDEKIEYINKEMSNVVLSLDGRREINDQMRPTPNDSGSYDVIMPKYKKLVEGRTNPDRTDYYLRGTFTKLNLDFATDILAMREEGFREISIEPVVTDPSLPYALTEEDIPQVLAEYDRLYDIMRSDECDFNFFHFNIDLNQGPCVIKRLRGCGCGNEYVAITPEGDIFPCHQFVGIDEWKMGNIVDGDFTLDERIKEFYAGTHIYSKQECGNCWARFYCSGGCNAASFLYEGDVKLPHKLSCAFMKKRIECAIALRADNA